MATIDSASSWREGGNYHIQCATQLTDVSKNQSHDMERAALARNIIPPLENPTDVKLPPDVDRTRGTLDGNLDRKFLNNNNTTSMKCLQYFTPPDPPPPPALLFDYVVEQSIHAQPQHQLLDSEIKGFENISFTSNNHRQAASSLVDDIVTNTPIVITRPVVRTEDVDATELKAPQPGTERVNECVNLITTNASTNHTSDQNTTKSEPPLVAPAIITTQSNNPSITVNSANNHCGIVNHHNHQHHSIIAPPDQMPDEDNALTCSVTTCDNYYPRTVPSLPSITTESPTKTKHAFEATDASIANMTANELANPAITIVTASAATCSSKPPIPTNSHHYHQSHPHLYHPHSQTHGGLPTTSPHSVRFMTQHIKILPKTQSLDLVDNDDLLEASNRTESQLDINTAGVPLKGRVLPKLQTLDQTRPIYPNVPYSPYNSPYGSPRSGRRRTPLRESRRVSIEQSGSFLQLNQYKLLDQIGQGSYGLVKLAYSEEDSTHYAMKILSKRKLLRKAGLMRRGPKRGTSPLDRVYREIAVLKKLDHPNVVKLVEVLDDPLEDSLYLVFELVQHGEILSVPTDSPLSEDRAWHVFRDVILGVEYLHYQRIIHGDLKPANLLLSDTGSVKVADLGVCNEFLGEDAAMNNGSTAGTPAFRAPETLLPGQHVYNGKAADIWALGATLYAIVHGNVPFIATSVPGVYEKIKNDPLQYPPSSTISIELKDLIERMLDKDPQQRITLPQIKEHAWITRHGVHVLPTEEDNCRLVQINDEDMNTVVKSIPKLDTLILIKTMLKKHSFQNPFTRAISGRAPQVGGSRIERFSRSGRSNSAPGDYHTSERQPSNESLLPSVTEGVTSPSDSPEEQSSSQEVAATAVASSHDSKHNTTSEKATGSDQMNLPNRACLEVLL